MDLIGQQPRYMQIAQALLNDIRDGRYQVGDLLPTEQEFCTQFGVSRFTMRQALRQVSDLGMISRQPGVGTRLISSEVGAVYRQGLESVSDIHQYAANTELHVLRTTPLTIEDDSLAQLLRASPGQVWLKVESLRRTRQTGDKPICYTEIFLPPPFRTVRGLEDKARDAVYRLVESQFGERTVQVRQVMRADALPPELAEMLEAAPHSPCLWITRHYLNARGEVIEFSRSAHPGDRFHYQQVFRQKT